MTADPAAARMFLFDIDGVFLAGKRNPRLVSGTRVLRRLRDLEIPFRLITNTSTHPRQFLADTLGTHGIEVAPEHIHSALEVTVAEATRRFPGGRCHVVGEPGMAEVAAAAGLEVVPEAPADVVLVGLTRHADYALLSAAARCLESGAALLACHRNRMWVDDTGRSLSCGPWLAALEYATGAEAEIFGKPTAAFYDAAREPVGVPASRTWMVGDDPESDVRGAQLAGLRGALVLTGKTSRADIEASEVEPDLVLGEVDDLVTLL